MKDVRTGFLDAIGELRKKTKRKNATVIAILNSISCEELAKNRLYNKEEEDVRFDSYYLEKHEVARRKLIDRLKTELGKAGFDFQLLTEENGDDFGRRDIVPIHNGRRLAIESKDGQRLGVEIKGSVGLDISQLERYLLSGEKLLLVRIITNQVKLLDPQDYTEHLNSAMQDLTSKAQRILDDRQFLVPGLECSRCPLTNCVYNKSVKKIDRKFVCMTHEDFNEDLTRFLQNLYPTIERAVEIILQELGVKPTISLKVQAE